MKNNIVLWSVMSELGAGTRGASLGWQAMRMASLQYAPTLFKRYPQREVPADNEALFGPSGDPRALYLTGISQMYQRIEERLQASLESGHFPLVLAGDHSNAGGTIAALKKALLGQRLGVIWVDAHADLHSPYTSPSGNVHGMPLATALGEDNRAHAVGEPSAETEEQWQQMKGEGPRLQPQDLVFIGVRSAEAAEKALLEQYAIPNFTVDQLRVEGAQTIAQKARQHLSGCDVLYLSFDVDSLDPRVSVGTGTPVENGFTEAEATELLLHLTKDERLRAFELVEVNPLLDRNGNSMAEAAVRILEEVSRKIEGI